jgi:hypothetical protein
MTYTNITLERIAKAVRSAARRYPNRVAKPRPVLSSIPGGLKPDDLAMDSVTCTYLGFRGRLDVEVAYGGATMDDGAYYEAPDVVSVRVVTPRCIIGTALHDLGVDDAELGKYEGTGASSLIRGLLDLHNEGLSEEHRRLLDGLNQVQSHQDKGRAWGDAVKGLDESTHLDEMAQLRQEYA